MPEKIPYRALEQIARWLLLLLAVFFTLSIVLLVRAYSRDRTFDALQAQLLSKVELQTKLLSAQASDHCFYPHLDPDVGYVLNPYMKRATWKGPRNGEGYAINSLGLRGEEIHPKEQGALRILLLGDSILFGWKLKEEHTLDSVMGAYLETRFPDRRIEVVTAALPSWNVLSEAAFLHNHFSVLQPDLIVWGLARNDIGDVSGVIPPGQLAKWHSPQRTTHSAFAFGSGFSQDLPMPTILERWDRNISTVLAARETYGLPMILLWSQTPQRPFFELVMSRQQARVPTVFVPGALREDRSSWCVAENDCHPSRRATRIMALGLLDKLARMDLIPALELDEQEREVVREFRKEEARAITPEQIEDFLTGQLARVPTRWAPGAQQRMDSALYGLNVWNGNVGRDGGLFLRNPGESSTLALDLETPSSPGEHARSAVFTVRTRDGETSRLPVDVVAGRSTVEIPLPDARTGTVYELLWQFDYVDCRRPDSCSSGKLHGATFKP